MTPKRSLSLPRKLLFSVITSFLVLAGAETALRALGFARGVTVADDAMVGHRLVPSQDRQTEHGDPIHINDLGLRDEDFPRHKPTGEYRILLLGDSLTFGIGVAQEQTFPRRLHHQLLTRCGGGSVRVMNAGVMGYDSKQERDYLTAYGFDLEPDLVVVMFFHNDIWFNERKISPLEFYGRDALRRTALFRAIEQWHRSRLAEQMGQDGSIEALKQTQFLQLLKQYTGEVPSNPKSPEEATNTRIAAAILGEMRSMCRNRSIRFAVAMLPAFHNTADPTLANVQGALAWELNQAKIKHTYLIDALKDAHPSCWLDFDPGHLSPHGHQLVADAIERWLIQESLVPCE